VHRANQKCLSTVRECAVFTEECNNVFDLMVNYASQGVRGAYSIPSCSHPLPTFDRGKRKTREKRGHPRGRNVERVSGEWAEAWAARLPRQYQSSDAA
jgi:hypothetical protein